MKKPIPYLCSFALLAIAVVPAEFAVGQHRRVVVRPARVVVRHPVRRHAMVVRREDRAVAGEVGDGRDEAGCLPEQVVAGTGKTLVDNDSWRY